MNLKDTLKQEDNGLVSGVLVSKANCGVLEIGHDGKMVTWIDEALSSVIKIGATVYFKINADGLAELDHYTQPAGSTAPKNSNSCGEREALASKH